MMGGAAALVLVPVGVLHGTGDLGGASGTVSFGGTEDDFGTAETTYQRHYATVPATPATGPSTYDEARSGYELGQGVLLQGLGLALVTAVNQGFTTSFDSGNATIG